MDKTNLILKYFQKSGQLTVDHEEYQKSISTFFAWLADNDKVNHDKTTKYFPNLSSKAKIIAKQEGIISGIEEIEYLVKKYTGLTFKSFLKDGLKLKNHEVIAEITGKSHEILGYERTILNILQRMSGIATETNRLVKSINRQQITDNKKPYIAATRKTPWMSLDKKAVAVGGGLTHRLNLSDGILIKDNHLVHVSIEKAVKMILNPHIYLTTGDAKEGSQTEMYRSLGYLNGRTRKLKSELIEIEVENFQQAHRVIKSFSNLKSNNHLAIMLDNFTPELAKQTLTNLRKEFDLSNIIFEASGGIDEKNILEWAKTGVDILSLGSLTHSTHSSNFSLEFTL